MMAHQPGDGLGLAGVQAQAWAELLGDVRVQPLQFLTRLTDALLLRLE